jgi:uncharacterized protein
VAVHDPHRDLHDDAAAMSRAAAAMRYARVSQAGGDSDGDGDGPGADAGPGARIVGRVADDVAVRGASQGEVAIAVAGLLLAGGADLVTLLAGERADPGLVQQVAGHVRQAYPAAELACYDGGPADSFLLIGAE